MRLADDDGVAGAARVSEAWEIIAELLDEEELQAAWRRALYGERCYGLQTQAQLSVRSTPPAFGPTAGPLGFSPGALFSMSRFEYTLIEPAWQLDAISILERNTALAAAARFSTLAMARQHVPASPDPNSRSLPDRMAHFWSTMGETDSNSRLFAYYRTLAERRLAAAGLAIKLYEHNHGQRPAALGDLVPEYLPAIPADPLDPAGGVHRGLAARAACP